MVPSIPKANGLFNPVTGPPLLLETHSDATAGYSLRDIGANGGRVVRVRRDTGGGAGDDDEEDFSAAEVADGTIETFVGAGNDGYVSVWYDQSSNSNHATQTSNSSQPKIVDGGVIVKKNNQPTISFGTNNNNLTLSTPLGIFNNLNSVSFFMVVHLMQSGTATQGILTLNPVFPSPPLFILESFGINIDAGGTNFSYDGVLNNRPPITHNPNLYENILYSALTEGSNFKAFADGSNIMTRSTVDIQPSAAGLIGAFMPGILVYGGTVSEIIVFDSGKANDRANIEENLANYYNITLS